MNYQNGYDSIVFPNDKKIFDTRPDGTLVESHQTMIILDLQQSPHGIRNEQCDERKESQVKAPPRRWSDVMKASPASPRLPLRKPSAVNISTLLPTLTKMTPRVMTPITSTDETATATALAQNNNFTSNEENDGGYNNKNKSSSRGSSTIVPKRSSMVGSNQSLTTILETPVDQQQRREDRRQRHREQRQQRQRQRKQRQRLHEESTEVLSSQMTMATKSTPSPSPNSSLSNIAIDITFKSPISVAEDVYLSHQDTANKRGDNVKQEEPQQKETMTTVEERNTTAISTRRGRRRSNGSNSNKKNIDCKDSSKNRLSANGKHDDERVTTTAKSFLPKPQFGNSSMSSLSSLQSSSSSLMTITNHDKDNGSNINNASWASSNESLNIQYDECVRLLGQIKNKMDQMTVQ